MTIPAIDYPPMQKGEGEDRGGDGENTGGRRSVNLADKIQSAERVKNFWPFF
jgi:hypothetical protein